jgi:hypothetical protein
MADAATLKAESLAPLLDAHHTGNPGDLARLPRHAAAR